MMERDVVLQKIPVMKVKEIVMDQQMEVNRMAMQDVKEILFVEATIALSLEHTSMRRMIAVKDLILPQHVKQ